MTQFVFANNIKTSLAAPVTSTGTTITLASAAGLPTLTTGQMMPLTLTDAKTLTVYECVYVTAINGLTLTVNRAQEGTGAYNWNTGDLVMCGPTADSVADAYGNPNNMFHGATASQFDDSSALASTEFVQDALGNLAGMMVNITVSTALDSTAFGRAIQLNSSTPITITLPPAAQDGAALWLYNDNRGNVTVTVANPATDFIDAPPVLVHQTSFTLRQGDRVFMVRRGDSEWDILGGSWMARKIATTMAILTDTGAANAYAASNDTPMAALPTTTGVTQLLRIANTNTGASTYAPDGLATAPIYGMGGVALQGGEIVVNGLATLVSFVSPLLNNGNLCWVLTSCTGGALQVASGSYGVTAAQFDATTQVATDAFVQRALGNLAGNIINVTASTVLDNTAFGKSIQLNASAAITLTLPPGLQDGAALWIHNDKAYTATVTVANTATDFIDAPPGLVHQTSFTMDQGDSALLVRRGDGEWDIIGGSWMARNLLMVTPPQFDDTTKLPTTQWVNQRGVAYPTTPQAINGSPNGTYAIPVSGLNNMWHLCGTGPYTVTLPPLASCPMGSTLYITNGAAATCNVVQAQGDTALIGGSTSGISLLVGAAVGVAVQEQGYWRMLGTSADLPYRPEFQSTLSSIIWAVGQSGYLTLPGNPYPIVIQAGFARIPGTTTSVTVTLPIAFNHTYLLGVVADSGPLCCPYGITPIVNGSNSNSQITIYAPPYVIDVDGVIVSKPGNVDAQWVVIGY